MDKPPGISPVVSNRRAVIVGRAAESFVSRGVKKKMGVITCKRCRAKTCGTARGRRTSVGWPAQRFTQLQLTWNFVFFTLTGRICATLLPCVEKVDEKQSKPSILK